MVIKIRLINVLPIDMTPNCHSANCLMFSGVKTVSTHQGGDALVGQIVLCGGVVLHQLAILGVVALADLVDL